MEKIHQQSWAWQQQLLAAPSREVLTRQKLQAMRAADPGQHSAATYALCWQQRHSKRVDRWQPPTAAAGGEATFSANSGRHAAARAASMQRKDAIMAAETAEQLLQLVQQPASQRDTFNVTAAFSRAGKLCVQQGSMLQDAAMQQLRQLLPQLAEGVQEQFNARELSNIIHACVALQLPGVVTGLLPLLLQPDKLAAADPQTISNVLWAAADMDLQLHEEHLQAMLQRFVQVLPSAKGQEISNTIWAVASTGQQLSAAQLQALLQRFMKLLPDAKPQEISNTLWAVASTGHQVPAAQLQALLHTFIQLLPDAKPQAISNTLWAVADLGQQLRAAQLQPLLQQFMQLLPSATPQDISNTLWAVVEMGQFLPVQLLDSLGGHWPLLLSGKLLDFSSIAYALGQMGYSTEQLPGDLLQQAVLRLGKGGFGTQECADLCWTAAVLDLQAHAANVLKLAAATATTAVTWRSCSEDERCQLYQAHLWLLDTVCSAGLSKGSHSRAAAAVPSQLAAAAGTADAC